MSARAFALQSIVRTALLLFWSLVAWGALLLLVTLLDVAGEGVRPALARLLPSRGASTWAWLNALSVALALGVGLVAGGLFAWGGGGRQRAEPPASSSERPGE
jgi:hypothetical protein